MSSQNEDFLFADRFRRLFLLFPRRQQFDSRGLGKVGNRFLGGQCVRRLILGFQGLATIKGRSKQTDGTICEFG